MAAVGALIAMTAERGGAATGDGGEHLRLRPCQRRTFSIPAACCTLAADLLRCKESFQDFVIVHELLHLRVPNHGRLFKALLTAHIPNWQTLDLTRKA
jgi:predicted metal-dependent hydrolase